jgi:tetratricopeptide (TPR) repeat protein
VGVSLSPDAAGPPEQDAESAAQRASPTLAAAVALLAAGEGGRAVAALQALSRATPDALGPPASHHYWLGLAYTLAYDWVQAAAELRAYLAREASGWRAGWAFLHLGRVYEQAGRDDEASLAYRGCLGADGSERAARRLAFDLMSRLAGSRPMGYGQAPSRPAADAPRGAGQRLREGEAP